jgi:cytochrome c-type biogenesis protein
MIELSIIGATTAFIAGIISFLSPCVLPLVPGYVSYISGQSNIQSVKTGSTSWSEKLSSLPLSLSFVLGFSTIFIAFGASASLIGRYLMAYREEANLFGGIVIIIFGIFISGLIRFKWLEKETRYYGDVPGGKGVSAYLLGLAFAFGWTPCIGPILGSILTLSATSAALNQGTALLAIYSMGLGVPFILAAMFTEHFTKHSQALKKHGRKLQVIAGGLMILMGFAMIFGYITSFSIWILKTFPILGQLG